MDVEDLSVSRCHFSAKEAARRRRQPHCYHDEIGRMGCTVLIRGNDATAAGDRRRPAHRIRRRPTLWPAVPLAEEIKARSDDDVHSPSTRDG